MLPLLVPETSASANSATWASNKLKIVSFDLSGKRDSNSRPQPWQGCALPTELFPLGRRNNTPLHAHVNTIYGLDFTFLRAACSSTFRLGQAAHRYCRPDHRVSSAAAASSQSPRWKTGSPSQISLVFCCPGV